MMRNRFDEQLNELNSEMIRMGALCEEVIALAAKALSEGRPFWIDGRSAFPALSLVLNIVRSSEEKRWITLDRA